MLAAIISALAWSPCGPTGCHWPRAALSHRVIERHGALRCSAEDHGALFALGAKAMGEGDIAAARSFFARAAEADPTHAPTKAVLEKLAMLDDELEDEAMLLEEEEEEEEGDDDDDDDDESASSRVDAALAALARTGEAGASSVGSSPPAPPPPSSELVAGAVVAVAGSSTPIGLRILESIASAGWQPAEVDAQKVSAGALAGADAVIIISAAAGGKGGIEPEAVEDVFMGCGMPEGESGMNIGRNAALAGGCPVSTSGTTINRFCSSGLQAVAMAAQSIVVDGVPVAIGGGLDSISLVQPKMIKGVVVERRSVAPPDRRDMLLLLCRAVPRPPEEPGFVSRPTA